MFIWNIKVMTKVGSQKLKQQTFAIFSGRVVFIVALYTIVMQL